VSALRGIILAIRFACELAMVVTLGYWGFEAVDGTPAGLLGIGAPAVAVAIWGAFVAPKARWPASIRVRGQPLLAALLAVAAGITSILNAATAGDETRSVA
jgi:hypothetical protein